MPKFEEHNPEKIKVVEKKEPKNIIEYFEQDICKKEEEIEWLEVRKKALEDIIERSKNLPENILEILENEIKEFEIEIRVNKSIVELTRQRLAEKKAEVDENNL